MSKLMRFPFCWGTDAVKRAPDLAGSGRNDTGVRGGWWVRLILFTVLLGTPVFADARVHPHSISRFGWRSTPGDLQARLDRIADLVDQSNVPNLVGSERWRTLLSTHRSNIERAESHSEFADAVNALLKDAGISHFHYYTDDDWPYWHLQSYFGSGGPETKVAHIGIFPRRIGDSWFVNGVLEGSPASSLDIRVGDELLTVDGLPFHPVASFRGKEETPVTLRLRRKPGLTLNIRVTPVKETLHKAFQRAIRQSVGTVEHAGLRFAYLHGWSLLGWGREYHRLLTMQSGVDGLLLDYRDGFGGSSDNAMNFFFGDSGTTGEGLGHWVKPAVILTADGTRSAKEVVVDAVKQAGVATLVGTSTPGEVTSVGSVRRIGPDGLLMLPAHRTALEGKPTQPDYWVDRDIRYCAGADPQIKRAKEILVGLIREPALSN
ncbi:MAG: hypothetical protein JSU63_20485 [Phycisphaerales bacterium]|nr:MAG: hypothetical protein JSU63_20485 [Phycisphaerales bacterium]